MSFCVGSHYFHASISHDQISNILKSDIPPEMSIWEKIKDFFCFTHQAEALKCFHQLCHPPAGTTIDDVKILFERLQKLAHPGNAGNIQIFRDGLNHFSITDKDGKEILSVVFADKYTVTTGGGTLSYYLTENNCVSNVPINNTLISEIPSGLWNKINDFFCFTHQAEALKCFHQLFHLPEGTTADNVKMLFERLQELAHPEDVDNIQILRDGLNRFSLTDKGGKEMLSIVFADDYAVTTWGRITYFDEKGCAHSAPLT